MWTKGHDDFFNLNLIGINLFAYQRNIPMIIVSPKVSDRIVHSVLLIKHLIIPSFPLFSQSSTSTMMIIDQAATRLNSI
jgi:hypothetical protein